jgi:hypothetical protein
MSHLHHQSNNLRSRPPTHPVAPPATSCSKSHRLSPLHCVATPVDAVLVRPRSTHHLAFSPLPLLASCMLPTHRCYDLVVVVLARDHHAADPDLVASIWPDQPP